MLYRTLLVFLPSTGKMRQAFNIRCVIDKKEIALMRAEISEKVIQLFVDIIGFIDRSEVTELTDFVHDFEIIDDDLTCFVMQIKWQFKLQATQEDWDHITTIKQIVDLIVERSTMQRGR